MTGILAAWLAVAVAQAAGYRIAGTVVTGGGDPVDGALIAIEAVENRAARITQMTAADGRFDFRRLPQGKYNLIAQKPGFLTWSYGQRAPGLTSAVVTGPGQDTQNLVFRLLRTATISGRVLDEAGEPVETALIEVYGSMVFNGRRRLMVRSFTRTNDLGEYRLASLAPGTYYLVVSGYPWYTKFNRQLTGLPDGSITRISYGVKYYPNAGKPTDAERLILKEDQEVIANFTLLPAPAASIHVNIENDREISMRLLLTAAGPSGTEVVIRQASYSGSLYNFWGIPAGHYTLSVDGQEDTTALYAKKDIDVGTADEEVDIDLAPAPTISGSLKLEGGARMPDSFMLLIHEEEGDHVMPLPSRSDGRIFLPGIPPGKYRLSLNRADRYYLKSWSVEGARRTGQVFEVAEGSAVTLKILAGAGAGRIEGTVVRDGRPLSGAAVVLGPATGGDAAVDYQAFQTDSDGSYEFAGLAPGTYAVFAVEDGSDLEWANPAVVAPYLRDAERVQVEPDRSYSKRLECTIKR